MKRDTILVSFVVALCCMTLSFFSIKGIESRLRIQIKKEVKEEMSGEIRLAVAKAVSSQAAPPYIEAARAVVMKVEEAQSQRLASAKEMEFFVAGAMDSGVPASGEGQVRGQDESGSQQNQAAAIDPEKKKAGRKKFLKPPEDLRKTPERAIDRALVDKGGMLLPKGVMQVEPSFTVAHFSSNRINILGFSILPAIILGNVSTESVKRDIFILANTFRRGLIRNLQGEIKIPFRYEYDRTTSNLGAETCSYEYGLGDIEMTLSRQLTWEKGLIPDSVASFTVKTPSAGDPYGDPIGLGTGHWGFRGSIVAVKSSDPAVVFGSFNYTWNLGKDVGVPGYGDVEPGNSIGWSLGTAIGLSYQTAINFAFEQNVTYKSSVNGHNVKGSFLNSCDLKAGFTWAISERTSVNFSATVGLTTDAPDYIAEISVPYTF